MTYWRAGAEAGDADGVGRAAFEEMGPLARLNRIFGIAAGAAFAEGVEVLRGEGGVDVEAAGAGGAEEGFVAGEGEHVDVVAGDIDGDGGEGLGGVDEGFDVVFFGDSRDLGDGLDDAGDVGGVGDGDEAGLGGDGFFDGDGIEKAGLGGEGEAREGDEVGVGHGLERTRNGGCVRRWW